ncbi:MAG: hypothetical protein KC547_15740, partial [Anaerolineae bacterium]|nr:hypothetical protein [Anaerolineae bacterium]
MPSASIFSWREGRGWLVLAPASSGDPDIRALAVARASADGSLAVAVLDGDLAAGDRRLDDLEELGAPSGYLVDVLTEADDTIETRLAETSICVLESDADTLTLRSGLMGAALRGLETAFANGAIVLLAGTPALLFGRLVNSGLDMPVDGFGWLFSAIVMPAVEDLSEQVRTTLQIYTELYAVGI